MIKDAIAHLAEGRSLDAEHASGVMLAILNGDATPAQFGALMMGLRIKGESSEELLGFASAMRAKVTPVPTSQRVVDTCGTGGDGAQSFNISTAAAMVLAAADVPVAKHGNRAASSRCGSADVLEGLGVKIVLTPEQVARSIDDVGFGFMFAPLFHPSMRFAGPLRPELGTRTVFNLLGPLTNPAGARYQLLGVPHVAFGQKMAEALAGLGTTHALVVCGDGNVDELALSGPSHVWEVRHGSVATYVVDATDYGLPRAPGEACRGGDVATNVRIIGDLLRGQEGAPLDAVALNAGAALYAADRVSSIAEGVGCARELLRSGAAARTLESIVAWGAGL